MLSLMNKYTLLKESVIWLYRFMPSDMSVSWNVNSIGKIAGTLKEACAEMMMIIKHLYENDKATVYEISALFSPTRRKLILSAAKDHTFVTKIDKKNKLVKFERDQSDVIPAVNLEILKESQTAKALLIADLVVESTIFALNICGYGIVSLNKIHEKLLKVKELLQSKNLISFFINMLGNANRSPETSKAKLVLKLLYVLHKEGVRLEIIRELADITGWLDIFKAFGKVTVLIIATTNLPSRLSFAANFLKGSELLNKIDTVMQIFRKDLRSKL